MTSACQCFFFPQEKKEGEDSDEEAKEGAAAAADKPASDSEEDSSSDEEEVRVVNIAVIFQENGSKFMFIDFSVLCPCTSIVCYNPCLALQNVNQ